MRDIDIHLQMALKSLQSMQNMDFLFCFNLLWFESNVSPMDLHDTFF